MGFLDRFRRTKKHAQPDYGTKRPLPAAKDDGKTDIAPELPDSINALAGGIPKWEDPVFDLDPDAYRKMRTCHAIVKAIRKLAMSTAKLNWTVVGKGARAEEVAEIFGQITGWTDFIEWLTWALVEGVRFYQIKTGKAREGSIAEWQVPNFFMGGRLKKNAGGSIVWDASDKPNALRQEQVTSGAEVQSAMDLPIDQFVIHRPGGGSNPEGDLWLGVALFNTVAKPAPRAIISGDLFVRLFAIPAPMLGAKLDKSRPTVVGDAMQARVDKMVEQQGSGKPMALSSGEVVQLLQANPEGLKGIVEWLRYLESIADDIITLSVLTSSSGIADAKRTGDTEVHKDEKDIAAFTNGVQIAEAFNRHVMPWIIKKNEGSLTALEEGESEVYLWPADPEAEDEQDIEVETEGVEGGEIEGAPKGPGKPVVKARGRNRYKKLAKPAAMVLPPVHTNCRCHLDIDIEGNETWVDAADSSVCPECRAYGAIFNAIQRGPVKLTAAEVDAMEDARGSKDYKAALERDTAAESRSIGIAFEFDKEGLLSQVAKRRGITPNMAELQEAIEEALDKSRAAADVQAGSQIGRGGRGVILPEAVFAPQIRPGFVQPQFVGAVVTKGRGYSVVQRNYRWHVFNTRTNKVIGMEDSLWLALLVFAALEESDRRAREKAQREREMQPA